MKNRIVIISAVVLVLVVALAAYMFTNTTPAGGDDLGKLTAQVGALMLLPDEVPTVATVSDPSQLKQQPFFANAEVGDQVLVYPKARKAVLYSPSRNKIIEVSPLSEDAVPPQQ